MALFICGNRGRCVFADRARKFTWSGRGNPVCPSCGRSEYVQSASGVNLAGLIKNKWLWIIGGCLIFVFLMLLGSHPSNKKEQDSKKTYLSKHSSSQRSDSANSPVKPKVPEESEPISTPIATTPIVHPELFGMVEIGGKGVKGIVVDLGYAEREKSCQKDDDAYAECASHSIVKSFDPINVNPVEKASLEDTVKAARKFFDEMANNLSVDPRQIYLVGSSSINNINLVPHRDELKRALEDGLGHAIKMDFVTAEQEGEWGFRGTLNLIPEKWRAKRKNVTVVLDIGGADTKGGYLEVYEGHEEFVPIAVPWGTKTFTNAVEKQMDKPPQSAFPAMAMNLGRSVLRPIIHEEVSRKQGLINRTRVYLIGGIAWATSTFVHPDNKGPFPVMKVNVFNKLYQQAILPNAAANLYSVDAMSKYPAIEKVRKAFTPDNIVAGLEILKAFSDEMRFKDKKMFFIRDSLYAWPLGYITHRCKQDSSCPQ